MFKVFLSFDRALTRNEYKIKYGILIRIRDLIEFEGFSNL